jgi:hypothetical protein
MASRYGEAVANAADGAQLLAGSPFPGKFGYFYNEETGTLDIQNPSTGAIVQIPLASFALGSPLLAKEVTFTETDGAGTYTGDVALPAGATLVDIIVTAVDLWDNAGAVSLEVGIPAPGDPDGYFTAVDLKATDLLAGESICFALAGGVQGAYIANSHVLERYSASARTIRGSITAASTGGSTGRTRMTVLYSLPVAADISAATKA